MGVPPGGSVYVPTPGYTYTNNVHKQRLRAFLLPAAASLLLSRRLISDIDQSRVCSFWQAVVYGSSTSLVWYSSSQAPDVASCASFCSANSNCLSFDWCPGSMYGNCNLNSEGTSSAYFNCCSCMGSSTCGSCDNYAKANSPPPSPPPPSPSPPPPSPSPPPVRSVTHNGHSYSLAANGKDCAETCGADACAAVTGTDWVLMTWSDYLAVAGAFGYTCNQGGATQNILAIVHYMNHTNKFAAEIDPTPIRHANTPP